MSGGRRAFSVAEAALIQQLVPVLAAALGSFVTRAVPRPLRHDQAPGVIIIGADDRGKALTPAARDWLSACVPDRELTEDDFDVAAWHIAHLTRRGAAALSRIPTPNGWISQRGQALEGGAPGDVVITVQSASSGVLLPAVAAWYGVTPRERAVVEQACPPSRSLVAWGCRRTPSTTTSRPSTARRGVTGRDELIATLS
ncbi:hypothetical protein GCM10020000_84900 [Streptomyces olivoverticillatus]